MHGQHVVAVHSHTRDSVVLRARCDLRIPGRVRKGHFGCVKVVLADEQRGQIVDGGQVEAFVKGAVPHGAVAEEGDTDAAVPQQLGTVTGAGGLQDAGTYDAAGPHEADFRCEEMHAPAAAMGNASLPTVQFRDERDGGDPFGQRVAVAPVGAEDRVILG